MQTPRVTESVIVPAGLGAPEPGIAARPIPEGALTGLPPDAELLLPFEPVSPRRLARFARLIEGHGSARLRPVLDAIGLATAVILSVLMASDMMPASVLSLLAYGPITLGFLWARGTYRRRLRVRILDGIGPVVGAISVGMMVLVLCETYGQDYRMEPAALARLWVLSILFVGTGRVAAVHAQRWARRRHWVGRRALVVGAGVIGTRVARRLQEQPEYGLRPVGYLDADPVGGAPTATGTYTHVPLIGGPDDLEWAIDRGRIQHVVLAFSAAPDAALVPLAQRCEQLGVEVSVVPRLFEAVNDRFSYETVGGLPLLQLRQTNPLGWEFTLKHGLDRLIAAALLFALAPAMLAIALAVRLGSPGPALFRQRRVGRDGQVFDVLKFRSMAEPRALGADGYAPASGSAPGGIEGDDRRTRFGRILRRTSLDELPQLLNVLRGEMSLVGPRPERPEFVELFTAEVDRYDQRHRVKSGVTGWAQVHGLRGQTSLSDRIEHDNFYIEHWSLGLDAKIMAMTFVAMFKAAE